MIKVLNLIITGIPSILITVFGKRYKAVVLNLIITGIPSIPEGGNVKDAPNYNQF